MGRNIRLDRNLISMVPVGKGELEWSSPGALGLVMNLWKYIAHVHHAEQGQAAHVERYRSSPIMHSSVPDECKSQP